MAPAFTLKSNLFVTRTWSHFSLTWLASVLIKTLDSLNLVRQVGSLTLARQGIDLLILQL